MNNKPVYPAENIGSCFGLSRDAKPLDELLAEPRPAPKPFLRSYLNGDELRLIRRLCAMHAEVGEEADNVLAAQIADKIVI